MAVRRCRSVACAGVIALHVLVGVPGCVECEESGCADTLTVRFERTTPWENGAYHLDLDIDGQLVRCVLNVPYGPEGRVDTCDDEDTRMYSDPFADNVGVAGFSHDFGTPARVELTLSLDGDVLLASVVEPEYRKDEHADAACGPACKLAFAELFVP